MGPGIVENLGRRLRTEGASGGASRAGTDQPQIPPVHGLQITANIPMARVMHIDEAALRLAVNCLAMAKLDGVGAIGWQYGRQRCARN